jgi:hypothetical protein
VENKGHGQIVDRISIDIAGERCKKESRVKLRKRIIPRAGTNEVISDVRLRASMAKNAIVNLATSTASIKERDFLPCRAWHADEYEKNLNIVRENSKDGYQQSHSGRRAKEKSKIWAD